MSLSITASETLEEFWRDFNAGVKSCKDDLQRIQESSSAEDLNSSLTGIKQNISKLQVFATESTFMLPSYDIRRSQEELETTLKLFREVEQAVKPKKKFAFSARKKEKEIQKQPISQSTSIVNTPAKAVVVVPGSYVVAEKVNESIIIPLKDLRLVDGVRAQLLVQRCTQTTVSAMSVLGSVRLEHLEECCVFLGPCCTSVYLESCKRCTVFIFCHQLRIHTCSDCNLFVRVQSHPIIEDCSNMRFAPYSLGYPEIVGDTQLCDLGAATCWSNVIDFRWHKSTHSPNWHLIEEHERLQLCEAAGAVLLSALAAPTGAAELSGFSNSSSSSNSRVSNSRCSRGDAATDVAAGDIHTDSFSGSVSSSSNSSNSSRSSSAWTLFKDTSDWSASSTVVSSETSSAVSADGEKALSGAAAALDSIPALPLSPPGGATDNVASATAGIATVFVSTSTAAHIEDDDEEEEEEL